MPLFAGKIKFKDEVREIPVFAPSEDEAMRYLKSTEEWVDDGMFFDLMQSDGRLDEVESRDVIATFGPLCSVVGVVPILDPRRSPFCGEDICWHANCAVDELPVGLAFYGYQLDPIANDLTERERRLDMADKDIVAFSCPERETLEKEWAAYFWLEKQLVEKFDQIRFDGMDLTQALLLGDGVSDEGEVDPIRMRTAARVLAHEVNELKLKLAMLRAGIQPQEAEGEDNDPPRFLN